jgi:hypothetical protein
MISSLHFDGEDATKWEVWSFKMLAYAAKKGHKAAFLTDYQLGADEEKWTEAEKVKKVLMEAAWSQLALMVQGHTMNSVIVVKSEDPKEAWDKLKEEFEPKEIVDVADLNIAFNKFLMLSPKDNPTGWIKNLEKNNERVGKIEPKYLKDDFLMCTHVFSLLPKKKYESFITAEKKELRTMSIREMKKKIQAHWKQFIKEKEKVDDVFYGEKKHRKISSSLLGPTTRRDLNVLATNSLYRVTKLSTVALNQKEAMEETATRTRMLLATSVNKRDIMLEVVKMKEKRKEIKKSSVSFAE